MPESSLQSLWPTLSPRERDAMVAKAKGWKLWRMTNLVTGDSWQEAHPAGYEFQTLRLFASISWSEFDPALIVDADDLPEFSASWASVGPLLDEMIAAGCRLTWQPEERAGGFLVSARKPVLCVTPPHVGTLIAEGGESWPERIALCYCLWQGVQP